VRILAINPAALQPGAVGPFTEGNHWNEVALGTNLVDDYYKSTGAYVDWDCWFEGITPGEVVLELGFVRNGKECVDRIKLTVYRLEARWEVLGTTNEITDVNNYYVSDLVGVPLQQPTGPFPLGIKFFPGALDAGQGWSDTVQIRISTIPPLQGRSVYLKAFDPDDPSAKTNEVDGDLTGGDNRDTNHADTGELSQSEEILDVNGEAVVQFRVAHQPGDNHRVAVSLDQANLNVLDNNNVPPSQTENPAHDLPAREFTGAFTPLLTVWRRLNIELITMNRPLYAQNTWTGTWSNPRLFAGAVNDRVVFDISNLPVDNGQLGGGRIQINGVGLNLPDYPVFENSDTDDTVTVLIHLGAGIPGTNVLAGVTSGTFTVSDDDLDQATFSAAVYGSQLAGVPPTVLPFVDAFDLSSEFEPAFTCAQVATVNGTAVPFVLNLPQIFTNGYFDAYRSIRNTPISVPEFTTVVVGSGFQPDTDEDADPEQSVTKGASPHADGSSMADPWLGADLTGICVVFVEISRENGGEQTTTAHEICHTLGLPHNDLPLGGIMDVTPAGGSRLFPPSLKRIRDYVQP
jgi:hypothetical protein